MKRNILSVAVLLSLMGTGCKKYLEQSPDLRAQLDSPEKVSELLVNAYPGANYAVFAEAMSDNPVDVASTGVVDERNANPWMYKDVTSTSQDSPAYFWNACYEAIATANQALEACNSAKDSSAYRAQRGEALVARAYAHWLLVTLFSKAYDPATAATDPGIPYVTTPENVVIRQYDRKTVAYVYEMIEKDLQAGIPLLKDNYTVPAYHFTRKAAHTFASRFYLFKQEWQKVIDESNLAFPSNDFAANVRPWLSYQLFAAAELEAAFTAASSPGNLLIIEMVSNHASNYGRYQYSLTSAKKDAIISPLGQKWTTQKSYVSSSTFYYVKKYFAYFKRNSINASTGKYYTMMPEITTEEALLNRAEASVMLDKYDDALADANVLISQRMKDYNPSTMAITDAKITAYYKNQDKKTAYTNMVLDVKRAEYIHEGMRWFDILRRKISVTHVGRDGQTYTLAADDKRKLLQMPDEVTLSGIPLNPR